MNKQTPEKPLVRLVPTLDVHSIFRTIQGEGPFTGHPAVFIRLAGCNLQCPLCDTDYTTGRIDMTDHEVFLQVANMQKGGLVVITGGEPLRQNITGICRKLVMNGYFVQVETNGTLPPSSYALLELASTDLTRRDCVFFVCSPKTGRINRILRPAIAAYKYVLTEGDVSVVDGLPITVLDHTCGADGVARPHQGFNGPVYVQPADEKDAGRNDCNVQACIASTLERGHIFQIQLHKTIGME